MVKRRRKNIVSNAEGTANQFLLSVCQLISYQATSSPRPYVSPEENERKCGDEVGYQASVITKQYFFILFLRLLYFTFFTLEYKTYMVQKCKFPRVEEILTVR